MISLLSRGAEGLGSTADLEDPARSGPVERMSAPAEFHRSGVVVHHQDFCTPSGLRCEPEAALDPPTLQRRGGVRAVPASAGTFGDTYGTVVLRGHAKHLGGAMFPGQWFGSSGSYVTKARRRYRGCSVTKGGISRGADGRSRTCVDGFADRCLAARPHPH